MRCKQVQEWMAAYLDGGIDDAGLRADIALHLDGCAACRAERDAAASTLARVAPAIKAAGEAIRVPDVRWIDGKAQRGEPAPFGPAIPRMRSANHRQRSGQNLMESNEIVIPPGARRMPLLAGAISFAILLALLGVVAAVLSGTERPQSAGAPAAAVSETATPTAYTGGTESPVVAAGAETSTPTPTPDLANGPGGFVENAVDVKGLPEYKIPIGGGGGGGGGGGCPDVPSDQTVSPIPGTFNDYAIICLYDIPTVAYGTTFNVTMTSPSGKPYTHTFDIEPAPPPPTDAPDQTPPEPQPPQVKCRDCDTSGGVVEGAPRNPIYLTVRFMAAQEYGKWKVEASMPDGQQFASGTITPKVKMPIYSVTDKSIPLDPFILNWPYDFPLGTHLIIAARGLDSGKKQLLALYARDPARDTSTTWTMIAYFATRVTIDQEGAFRTEFVIGSQTPQLDYAGVLDPVRGKFAPVPINFTAGQPAQ